MFPNISHLEIESLIGVQLLCSPLGGLTPKWGITMFFELKYLEVRVLLGKTLHFLWVCAIMKREVGMVPTKNRRIVDIEKGGKSWQI